MSQGKSVVADRVDILTRPVGAVLLRVDGGAPSEGLLASPRGSRPSHGRRSRGVAEGMGRVLHSKAVVGHAGPPSQRRQCAHASHGHRERDIGHTIGVKSAPHRLKPKWFPKGEEPWPNYLRRSAADASSLWAKGGIPDCSDTVATTWWRWAGHAARLAAKDPNSWVGELLSRRDAWHLKTMRSAHAWGTDRA